MRPSTVLNFPLIQQIVREAKERGSGKELAFVIATNLALINREILEFCHQHDIVISTSLDGPKALHNPTHALVAYDERARRFSRDSEPQRTPAA